MTTDQTEPASPDDELPANVNQLIEGAVSAADIIDRAHDVLNFLDVMKPIDGCCLDDDQEYGRSLIMDTVLDALRYAERLASRDATQLRELGRVVARGAA